LWSGQRWHRAERPRDLEGGSMTSSGSGRARRKIPWPRFALRVTAVWLSAAAGIVIVAALLDGVSITQRGAALAAGALLALLNGLVWPVVVRFGLPLTVLTLGLGPLLLNGAFVLLSVQFVTGVQISSLWLAVVVALVITLVTTTVTALLALDDDDYWYRHTVLRPARGAAPSATDVPGVIFLQIDGLGHGVLQRALRDGDAPTMSTWVRRGSHTLLGWETDWSSQTGASQCGILMGTNYDMPAFRWLEKDTGTVYVSNHPRSAAALEQRSSTGRGLLFADGASRSNIYTGDAAEAVLTTSVAGQRKGAIGKGYYAYFADPYNLTRTIIAALTDVSHEIVQAARQRRRNVVPRVHRGGVYPLLRCFTTVISKDVTVATLIGDMYAGRSVVYADFVGYDEVAHHSGVERYEALDALRRLDRDIGRLEMAARGTPRSYRLVVLSDHGQSQGMTFKDRYGYTLGDLVTRSMGGAASVAVRDTSGKAGAESWGYAGGALDEVSEGGGPLRRLVRRVVRRRKVEGEVQLGPERQATAAPGADDATVFASGNLGLVYLTQFTHRLTREEIDEHYPKLLPALVEHPGVGFVLVKSAQGTPLVLGAKGWRDLEDGIVFGADPLEPFGPSAARQVLRTHGFPHCADLMVNSMWDEQTGEVAAFEELVGSHGGLGGEQTHPFVLYPSDLPAPEEAIHGAESLHQVFRGWLARLGHDRYADGADRGSDER
jgi:uncharacterized membrane protein YvlD (DUF360 family)